MKKNNLSVTTNYSNLSTHGVSSIHANKKRKVKGKDTTRSKKHNSKKFMSIFRTALLALVILVLIVIIAFFSLNYVFRYEVKNNNKYSFKFPLDYIILDNFSIDFLNRLDTDISITNSNLYSLELNNEAFGIINNIDINFTKEKISIDGQKNYDAITFSLSNLNNSSLIKAINVTDVSYLNSYIFDIYILKNNIWSKCISLTSSDNNLTILLDDNLTSSDISKIAITYVPLEDFNIATTEIYSNIENNLDVSFYPSYATCSNLTLISEINARLEENNKLFFTDDESENITIDFGIENSTLTRAFNFKVIHTISSLKLSQTSVTITKGKSATVSCTPFPDNAIQDELTWASNNEEIATVTNGTIVAKNAGNCTITVSTVNAPIISSELSVNVVNVVNSVPQNTVSSPTYINGVLIVNKTYALPSSYNPGLDNTTYSAFLNLKKEAANAGYNIPLVSGFRSYSTQYGLYNRYISQYGVTLTDTFSAKPGHSEHQSGLAMDVGAIDDDYGNTDAGMWLAANAHKFGFIIRYQQGKEHITGYKYEPWHIRYVGEKIATYMYENKLCLEEYLGVA